MKIHWSHSDASNGPSIRRRAACWLASIGVAVLCTSSLCGHARAQSGWIDQSTASIGPGSVQRGLFTHGNEQYQVVDTAGFRTVADIGTTPLGSIAQVGHGGCHSCGTACGGACGGGACSGGACGGGACGGGACGDGACGGACGGGACGRPAACGLCGTACGGFCNYGIDPCASCVPFYYASFDALYMTLDTDERYSLSPQFRMTDFDPEWAGRATIGCVPNCVDGYEVSYTGRFRWDRFGLANSFTGGIRTFLRPGTPFVPADLSAFDDADFQTQFSVAEYWGVEMNKTCVGWEVAKLLYGIRYVDYQEEYAYFSRDGAERGLLRSATENRMIGLQVGMDLLFPLTRNLYSDFRSRLGGYVNFSENDFQLLNAGALTVANFDDRADIAGMVELGGGLRYQLGQALTVRVLGELWYLDGIASATDQFSPLITQFSGFRTRRGEDLLIAGASFGAEVRF